MLKYGDKMGDPFGGNKLVQKLLRPAILRAFLYLIVSIQDGMEGLQSILWSFSLANIPDCASSLHITVRTNAPLKPGQYQS